MGASDFTLGSARDDLETLIEDQALAVLAALDDLRQDPDGSLHDTRVAVRRLRSSLRVFSSLLRDDDDVRALVVDLRWLTRELGQARDAQIVAARVTAALDARHVTDAQRHALTDSMLAPGTDGVRAVLAHPRLGSLLADLDLVVLRGAARAGAVDATQVRARVRAAVADTLARAEAQVPVDEQTGKRDRALHTLRKQVKAARVMLGAVRIAPRGSGVSQVSRSLEQLQDLLGDHQDAVVTEEALRSLASRADEVGALASAMAESERAAAEGLRADLPHAVRRLADAVARFERRAARAALPAVSGGD